MRGRRLRGATDGSELVVSDAVVLGGNRAMRFSGVVLEFSNDGGGSVHWRNSDGACDGEADSSLRYTADSSAITGKEISANTNPNVCRENLTKSILPCEQPNVAH